jgi:hypothetical protein
VEIPQVKRSRNVLTMDKSWFSLSSYHEMVWLQANVRDREEGQHNVHSKQLILAIGCRFSGFHSLSVLFKRFKFNAIHQMTNILDPLVRGAENRLFMPIARAVIIQG